ncbi:hypothetical protein FJT64_017986 [Amphibalanus amphitrite]|uniref:Uncharacterized protein n=1 Tax=Amphibalanus amphitrite TaxID=1232801 RepID=A0A6A4WUF8_AMPAM|nr:hypothetical protein FJT64_017986 [Amphibalanus amphitrite]
MDGPVTIVTGEASFVSGDPRIHLQDRKFVNSSLRRTLAGELSVEEFYNLTTLQLMLSETNRLKVYGRRPIAEPVTGSGVLGTWRERYYLSLREGAWPTRCFTFQPSAYLNNRTNNVLRIQLLLGVPPLFGNYKGVSYRLYFHGPDEPNLGDLSTPEHGRTVPKTVEVALRSRINGRFVVTVALKKLASLRRRPCRGEPGYSLTRCLKECQWRRLAALTGCRLPHMTYPGVFLPDTRGPLDHLPP